MIWEYSLEVLSASVANSEVMALVVVVDSSKLVGTNVLEIECGVNVSSDF